MRYSGILFAAAATALLVTGPVAAQTPESGRYGQNWGDRQADTGAEREQLDAMIGELRQLIKQADKARAADPIFLRDLSDLARRYAWPWHVVALVDDFKDGDLTRNPVWTTEGGEILTNRYVGVRTIVTPRRPHRGRREEPQRQDRSDIARQFMSALLQQQQGTQAAPEPNRRYGPTEASMSTPVRLSNAFALRLRLGSETTDPGRLEFGVAQGPGGIGYRVAYTPNDAPSFAILRVGSRGTQVVDATRKVIALEDHALHDIQFTRARNGRMTLSVDGDTVIDTVDQAFHDPFDGVMLINTGGDYTLRRIDAYGVR